MSKNNYPTEERRESAIEVREKDHDEVVYAELPESSSPSGSGAGLVLGALGVGALLLVASGSSNLGGGFSGLGSWLAGLFGNGGGDPDPENEPDPVLETPDEFHPGMSVYHIDPTTIDFDSLGSLGSWAVIGGFINQQCLADSMNIVHSNLGCTLYDPGLAADAPTFAAAYCLRPNSPFEATPYDLGFLASLLDACCWASRPEWCSSFTAQQLLGVNASFLAGVPFDYEALRDDLSNWISNRAAAFDVWQSNDQIGRPSAFGGATSKGAVKETIQRALMVMNQWTSVLAVRDWETTFRQKALSNWKNKKWSTNLGVTFNGKGLLMGTPAINMVVDAVIDYVHHVDQITFVSQVKTYAYAKAEAVLRGQTGLVWYDESPACDSLKLEAYERCLQGDAWEQIADELGISVPDGHTV